MLSNATSFDKGNICLSVDDYANTIMEEAEKKGIDNIWETWKAVHRIKARARGERFYEVELLPYNPFNHAWDLYGPDRERARFYSD